MEQIVKTNETKRTDIFLVDPRNVTVEEGFNVRKDMGDIEGLAKSVVECGVLVPIEGYKVRGEDRYVMTDGHRRLAAVMLALEYNAKGVKGFEDISKIEMIRLLPTSANTEDRLYIMAITGEKKKDLTDLEKADMYSRLLEFSIAKGRKKGEAVKEICTRLAVSQATFYNTIKLNELPEEIKQHIAKGAISGNTVIAITRDIKDADKQTKAVEEAVFEAELSAEKTGKKAKKASVKDVKGLKAKTPMQKLKAVTEKLVENEVHNVRALALIEAMGMLEEGKSINTIYALFI
jgi:ParB family chromosome partitioning protein